MFLLSLSLLHSTWFVFYQNSFFKLRRHNRARVERSLNCIHARLVEKLLWARWRLRFELSKTHDACQFPKPVCHHISSVWSLALLFFIVLLKYVKTFPFNEVLVDSNWKCTHFLRTLIYTGWLRHKVIVSNSSKKFWSFLNCKAKIDNANSMCISLLKYHSI